MHEISPDELKLAVESQHGGKATLVQSVPVTERYKGAVVWEGVVHVFDLTDHPTASRAYAWSHAVDDKGKRRFYAVLHAGPVHSAADAVKAAIVADRKRKVD